jgi:hypothetical protein
MGELLYYVNNEPWKVIFTLIVLSIVVREFIGFFLKTGAICDRLDKIVRKLNDIDNTLFEVHNKKRKKKDEDLPDWLK